MMQKPFAKSIHSILFLSLTIMSLCHFNGVHVLRREAFGGAYFFLAAGFFTVLEAGLLPGLRCLMGLRRSTWALRAVR
jgi:hypothetical protein